jgi:hypothetical protein
LVDLTAIYGKILGFAKVEVVQFYKFYRHEVPAELVSLKNNVMAETAESHDCGKEVEVESKEFEEGWFAGTGHTETGSEYNLVLCPDHRKSTGSLLDKLSDFLGGQ